MYYF
ncbi:hypothetical protein YPPY19_1393, partial [Yersinia pestis PY-19]